MNTVFGFLELSLVWFFVKHEIGSEEAMLLIDDLLSDGSLDFLINFFHDALQIILVLHLKLLVVATALVRGPPFENFAEPVKDFRGPSGFLVDKIIYIVHHKPEIDLILLSTPSSSLYFLLINL